MGETTFVYFITYVDGSFDDEQFFKVGIIADLAKRVAQLQIGNPQTLQCAWSVALPNRYLAQRVEREVHRALGGFHVGGEWFKCKIMDMVVALPSAVNLFRRELNLRDEHEVLEFVGYRPHFKPGSAIAKCFDGSQQVNGPHKVD